ncbi:hypothetical protein PILCRDRAFT_822431 [Piloderma croceum F 1598]|uniref:Uncharacterized protein n=1 Tax=Piloderma croceum (strain F 1598) TaxID=765440 RepID=A0A0C3F6M0_PILCF|nr:hypothetical protein PILCRDRAFT_822431 [Piloderma croceum F 1598]
MVPENINTQWRVLSPFVVVDGVLVLLVAYKLILYRKEMNRTFAVLARDSIFYFIIVFAFLALVLANDAGAYLPVNFLPPSQCISSIVAGRMMMNIRGLILDDPGNTIHLKSLHFAEGTYSDSETGVASSFALQTYAIA